MKIKPFGVEIEVGFLSKAKPIYGGEVCYTNDNKDLMYLYHNIRKDDGSFMYMHKGNWEYFKRLFCL